MNIIRGRDGLDAAVGKVLGTGCWTRVSQEMIDAFACTTRDEQWLHVDAARAAAGPYGTTIAHGYLVLSLLPALTATAYHIDGTVSRINYGLERVRFPSPIPSGSRLRVTSTLVTLAQTPHGTRIVTRNVVERHGSTRPGCVADTISLLVFDEDDGRGEPT